MHTLDKVLRSGLEKTICDARDAAESAAKVVIEQLGVGEKVPHPHLNENERKLRKKLRSHGRQLGDILNGDGYQSIDNLVEEVAYQHWHRMLFSRFLAENNLLMDDDPVSPISMSLEECNDMASSLGARSGWDLAARYAFHMLPQIFKSDNPIFLLTFPFESQKVLENFVAGIPLDIFEASDSLGWVYQFWQTKRKKEINASGVKIGASELPAVTQLFTEPYMVDFLLDNSLGAWWASRRLSEYDLSSSTEEQELRDKVSLPGMPLEYLRFVKAEKGVWSPASGTFDSWPKDLLEFKMLDPCCGSGHFLVAILGMLVPIRMELEGLSEDEAIEKVLDENIHGLELDQRCVELAAFALAFTAWTYPGCSGYRKLPSLHVACSGQAISIDEDNLNKLSNGNHDFFNALVDIKDKFENAPILGSLIDPKGTLQKGEMFSLDWDEIGPFLDSVLKTGKDDDLKEAGIVAQGLAKSASLLAGSYHLVATNVPYLSRGKQDEILKIYCDKFHKEAKNDLATVFLECCLQFCLQGGTASIVLPQNWLFLSSYKEFRKKMLNEETWHMIARLGTKSFQTPMWDFNVQLFTISRGNSKEVHNVISGIDVSEPKTVDMKAKGLVEQEIKRVGQKEQLRNPEARIVFENSENDVELLETYAQCIQGLRPADRGFLVRKYWEIPEYSERWQLLQSSSRNSQFYGGLHGAFDLLSFDHYKDRLGSAYKGHMLWGKKGISIGQMRNLPANLYTGAIYDGNINVFKIKKHSVFNSVWAYICSPSYNDNIRKIDQKLAVTNNTLVKVPFDIEYWTKIAEENFPNGLPLPFSDDPTQWIFHGHPCGSVVWYEKSKCTAFAPVRSDATILQVAVARLLGYRWPAELDPKMELAEEQRSLVMKCDELLTFADNDGIVCIPSVGGEFSASERLVKLLKASYGDEWTDNTLSVLLRNSDAPGWTTENWFRDKFFIQHCKLFGNRPFIWQIWDGFPDGFSALVNYHKLDYKTLETLTYTYLGDWILHQKRDVANEMEGARERLSAALVLSQRLEQILKGESPFDIFVRWKSIEEQPIGWNPDLNDGVRLNIRPFMAVADVGKRDTGILRSKPNIKWGKDRGKDVDSAPWYNLGPLYDGNNGDRINDHHLSLQDKLDARKSGGKR